MRIVIFLSIATWLIIGMVAATVSESIGWPFTLGIVATILGAVFVALPRIIASHEADHADDR